MPISQYPVRQVRAKTNEVKDYHYDDARPGKPLYLLIPGGLIALASLALVMVLLFKVFIDESIDTQLGLALAALLAPFYIGGVFLFSYGYELYDLPRALRLTAIIVFITLAAVVIIAVLFVLVGGSSKSSSRSKSSNASSRDGGGGGSSGGTSRSNSLWNVGSLFVNTPTRTVTHEVVREVPVQPPAPNPIQCAYCGRSYVPQENKFVCPSCGSAATPEQIAESEQR